MELPKPVDKIRQEDLTDNFIKSIDAGGKDPATIRLYLGKVCPQIRNQYDRDTFLNGLIEDLYYKCEDQMIDKKNNIGNLTKKVEKLQELKELVEGYGSDGDIP